MARETWSSADRLSQSGSCDSIWYYLDAAPERELDELLEVAAKDLK